MRKILYRSSITGRLVSEQFAVDNPDTTVRETIKIKDNDLLVGYINVSESGIGGSSSMEVFFDKQVAESNRFDSQKTVEILYKIV